MSLSGRAWRAAGAVDPRRFEDLQAGALRGWLDRGLAPAVADGLRRDPDGLLAAGTVLKDGPAATVVALEGGALVLKRFRFPDPLRALRRAPRRSRALLAFRAGLRLGALGLGVAPPLAVIERRRLGLGSASWLLSAGLPGRDAGALLADASLDAAARTRLVDALVEVVARLQRERIAHGDLKATNFLVDGDAVRLLDLHAVTRVRRPTDARLRRDRRRFLRNLEPWPALLDRARARLDP